MHSIRRHPSGGWACAGCGLLRCDAHGPRLVPDECPECAVLMFRLDLAPQWRAEAFDAHAAAAVALGNSGRLEVVR